MSDTPKTDHAEIYVSSFKRAHHKIEALLSSHRVLESSHNALIAKLEALAKKWDEFVIPNADYFDDGKMKGMENCAADLYSLIQEAKQ